MDKINKIKNKMVVEVGIPQKKYTLIIKEGEEILYQNEGFAGLLCFVEEIKKFSSEIEANHQIAGFGHPMAQWYCLDQMTKWFKENQEEFIETCIQNGIVKISDVQAFRDLFKNKNGK